ncbi:25512_t:CDS:2 [Gigaspora rosea]|nr:25512_t:CDS:2 [Gigaspora rosea]
MDITNLGKRIIAIGQINNDQPIASYNINWPSKMNAAKLVLYIHSSFLVSVDQPVGMFNMSGWVY